MTLLPLSNDEKNRLKLLNGDKATIFALKKLFLNVCVKELPSNEAIKKVTEAFHDLSVINSDNQVGTKEENMV